MIIYTFYSYKGGVGRTMALANIAELFYEAGLKVLMVDWDLEAPGLERFFPVEEDILEQPGVTDMLLEYKRKMAEESTEIESEAKTLPFESVDSYIVDIYPRASTNGRLWLLTAGRRSKEHFDKYANSVLTFDWRNFYQNWEGSLYFEWLRQQFETVMDADVVLIDSRTGVNEMGGVCTYQLADVVVMFCAANYQNLEGTYLMARDFRRPEVQYLRNGRPLEVIAIPARLEQVEGELLNKFKRDFLDRADSFVPSISVFKKQPEILWAHGIPYIPYYAYSEAVAVRERDKAISNSLVEAFQKLARTLVRMAPTNSSLKSAFGSDYAYDASYASFTSDFVYDVYISSNLANREWVWEWLVPRLKKAGLRVCTDQDSFDIGVPILINLENVVTTSRHILLVLGPQWLTEEWTLFEELIAQQVDATDLFQRILPVLLQPCNIPARLATQTYADFTKERNNESELIRLIDALRDVRRLPDISRSAITSEHLRADLDIQLPIASTVTPESERHEFYAHIPLPPNYVVRLELLSAVRDVLLNDSSKDRPIVRNRLTALHGMGGIGKSIIARALCADPKIQGAFPDGILWITLGQSPELISQIRDLIYVLGGRINENSPTVASLKDVLAKLLKDRACLLILDDVWQLSHVEVFLVTGSRCRLLLTTRDAEIAYQLGAQVVPIPVMTESEAVVLLEEWAGENFAETDPLLKNEIVKRLGYLPLAIKLAGAQLRRNLPNEWLDRFDIRKLKSRRGEDIHDNLGHTLQLSLNTLETHARYLYVALAIFKEDEAIPQIAIERLWQSLGDLDTEAIRDLIDDLAARALLEIISTPKGLKGAQEENHHPDLLKVVRQENNVAHIERWILLHDLLRDLLSVELGENRVSMHVALLNTYRTTYKGNGWHTAPDDGYLYDHLAYHLYSMRAVDELKALFANQKWLQVRVPQGNYSYDGYLSDLGLAWMLADSETRAQINLGLAPTTFAACARYAMICTSINSIGSTYIPELVMRAVEVELFTSDHAISIAEKIPDDKQRARMYNILLRTARLSPSQQRRVQRLWMKVALSSGEDSLALVDLAPYLQGRLLEQALEATLAMSNEKRRVEIVVALAPHLTGKLLEQALEASLAVVDDEQRAKVLAALVPQLSGNLRLQVIQRVVETTLSLESEEARAVTLTTLVPYLTGKQGIQTAQRSLEIALSLSDEKARAEVLAELAPHLNAEMLQRSLEVAFSMTDAKIKAYILAVVTPYLIGEQRIQTVQRSLEIALSLNDEKARAEVLAMLAPHLNAEMLQRSLDATSALADEEACVAALTVLAYQMAEEQQIQTVQRGLEIALALRDEKARSRALLTLAPLLRGALQQRGLDAAFALTDEDTRVQVLAAFLPCVTDKASLLKSIRYMLTSRLLALKDRPREDVLYFCANKALFTPPILLPETLSSVAATIIEVCQEWKWI